MYCIYCNRLIPADENELPVIQKRTYLVKQGRRYISKVRRYMGERSGGYHDSNIIIGYCCESCHDAGNPLIVKVR